MSGCLVLDMRMTGMSGLDCFDQLRERESTLPVIFLTGHGDVPLAVATLKKGAFDFFEKPFNDNDLATRIEEAMALDASQRKASAERVMRHSDCSADTRPAAYSSGATTVEIHQMPNSPRSA